MLNLKFLKTLKSKEILVLMIILAIAGFLRFYRLDEYMIFLGDEGRDALMMKRILIEHDFPLLGPPTSVGNMYLGPIYYYMMAVPEAIFWLNPVAAAGMIALIGTITVGLVYYFSQKWFGFYPAVLASFLYAVSPVNINYSRFSWNPNPTPFFALLALLGFYQSKQSGNYYWLALSGAGLAAALQMHYFSLLLLPFALIVWFSLFITRTKQANNANFVKGNIIALLIFFFFMSPLLIFDLKYRFMNYHAFLKMFSPQSEGVQFALADSLSKLPMIYKDKLILRYLGGNNNVLAGLMSLLLLLPFIHIIFRFIKQQKINWSQFILTAWLVIGLLGLSFYKKDIYDHYFGFLNPALYLLLAFLVSLVSKKWQLLITVTMLLILGYFNLRINPLLSSPNRQLQKTQEIARFIIQKAEGQPFNFALLAQNNYDPAYLFYLYLYGHQPKQLPAEKTDQLFVVCEDPSCQPIYSSKYEVAAFGWSQVNAEYELNGVKIYQLIHNPKEEE